MIWLSANIVLAFSVSLGMTLPPIADLCSSLQWVRKVSYNPILSLSYKKFWKFILYHYACTKSPPLHSQLSHLLSLFLLSFSVNKAVKAEYGRLIIWSLAVGSIIISIWTGDRWLTECSLGKNTQHGIWHGVSMVRIRNETNPNSNKIRTNCCLPLDTASCNRVLLLLTVVVLTLRTIIWNEVDAITPKSGSKKVQPTKSNGNEESVFLNSSALSESASINFANMLSLSLSFRVSDTSVYSERMLNTSEQFLDTAISTGVSSLTSDTAVGSTLKVKRMW